MEQLKGLYLDDKRTPMNSKNGIIWTIVRDYSQFTTWIEENGIPSIVSFDHDLGDEHIKNLIDQAGKDLEDIKIDYEKFTEKTGYDAAKWMVNYCEEKKLDFPVCTVHSANPVGAANIINYLNNYTARKGIVAIIKRTIW